MPLWLFCICFNYMWKSNEEVPAKFIAYLDLIFSNVQLCSGMEFRYSSEH